jgi:hypothetical protein
VASCAISCNDDAGIMLLRTATGKSERGFFYNLNGRAKRRAAGMLAKHDPASRRVRLSAMLDPAS